MKRIVAIALTAIMLLAAVSLAACGKETTKSIYDKTNEKMLAVDAMEVKMDVQMDMTMAGQTISSDMSYVIKTTGAKSDSPVGYADIEMDMLGQKVNVVSYVEGDYVYIYTMGEGMKLPKDSELAADYDTEATLNAYEIDIPEEILEATEFTTDDDGNYVLAFDFNGQEHADALKSLTDSIMAGMDTTLSGYEATIGDVKYVITVNKDDFTLETMKLEMTMDMTVEGMDVAVKVVADSEYLAFGDSVTITPPEGYQDFEELVA